MAADINTLIAELRAGLEGTTPGTWGRNDTDDYAEIIAHDLTRPVALVGRAEDADHVCRCSPDNVRALLDHIDRLTSERDEAREDAQNYIDVSRQQRHWKEEAEAELARLRKPVVDVEDIVVRLNCRATMTVLPPEYADLDELLMEAADLIQRLAAENARLHKEVGTKHDEANRYVNELVDVKAELARLRKRVGPRGLEVVMIDGVGHYVSEAVAKELARLRAPSGEVGEMVKRLLKGQCDVDFTCAPECGCVTDREAADLIQRLAGQVAEAREAIGWANNSLFGSHGFFLSLNGGPPNEHHLDTAIEELKERARRGGNAEDRLREAVEVMHRVDQFITNGIELGFIRMPDAGTPDPAHETPEIVRAFLATLEDQKTALDHQQQAVVAMAVIASGEHACNMEDHKMASDPRPGFDDGLMPPIVDRRSPMELQPASATRTNPDDWIERALNAESRLRKFDNELVKLTRAALDLNIDIRVNNKRNRDHLIKGAAVTAFVEALASAHKFLSEDHSNG